MAYYHFELCRDCGLGCFSELLADIRRLSVVAVVFLYQITAPIQAKISGCSPWSRPAIFGLQRANIPG